MPVLINPLRRAVFLDRDGVINRSLVVDGKPYPPNDLASMEILPGVGEALTLLSNAGFLLIVITNQPDVARGTRSRAEVEAINSALIQCLPIDAIRSCFHDHHAGCVCRKPAPGALLAAAEEYRIDLGQSYMIGDRLSDIEAGLRAGCRTFFIDYGYAEPPPVTMHYTVGNALEAAKIILENGILEIAGEGNRTITS